MGAIMFLRYVVAILSMVAVVIVANRGVDLEAKLKKANTEYDALDKKYKMVRRYCIKNDKHVPYGKYFVVGWLNMMQNIHTKEWYYISDEDLSAMGCDMDGDITTIIHAKKEED